MATRCLRGVEVYGDLYSPENMWLQDFKVDGRYLKFSHYVGYLLNQIT